MGSINTDDGDQIPADTAAESNLRGDKLSGVDRKNAVDHVAYEKARNTDTTLRLNGEKDTLYDDGLDVEDSSAPLTGIAGRDDTQNTDE
jgi:hypothetical protein